MRAAQLDLFVRAIGEGAVFEMRTRPPPADVRAVAGQLLASLPLSCKDFAPARRGLLATAKTLKGIASARGVLGHFRIVKSDKECLLVGTIGLEGSDGGMEMDKLDVDVDQPIELQTFQLTAGNL